MMEATFCALLVGVLYTRLAEIPTMDVDVALKVLVEAHGSRVRFVHPDDREIYSGLFGDITLTPLASI
jgi:hypothetical protein